MSDLEIVEGDLEKLSSSIGDVAATMAGVDLPTAMTHVPAAIPGATSASLASSATTALDTRRDSLQERYQDFSADVMTAANAYLADDAERRRRGSGRIRGPVERGRRRPGAGNAQVPHR